MGRRGIARVPLRAKRALCRGTAAWLASAGMFAAASAGLAQQGDEAPQPVQHSTAPPATAASASSPTPKPTEHEILIYGRPGAAPARTPRPKRAPVPGSVSATCSAKIADAFFEPSQGVWQDDANFHPHTPQLVRDANVLPAYRASLDMVSGRPSVLVGAESYTDASGAVRPAGDRHRILLTLRTDCSTNRPVSVDFELKQPNNVAQHFAAQSIPAEIPIAPPRVPDGRARTITIAVDAAQGFPADRTFTFTTGPWTLRASVLKENGVALGTPIEVSGRAIATSAPVTSFLPMSFLPSQGNFALVSGEAAFHSEAFARVIPDVFPLAPASVRAPVLPPMVVLTGGALPTVGEGISAHDRLAAVAADRAELVAVLAKADRLVGVVDDDEWASLFTDPVDAAETAGLAVAPHAVLVRAGGSVFADAHELAHTLPSLGWSTAGMVSECGRVTHDVDGLANGLRLSSNGQPAQTRREFEAASDLLARPAPGLTPDGATWIDKCTWTHLLRGLQPPPREQRVRLVRGVIVRQDDGRLKGGFGPFYDVGGTPDLTPVKNGTPPPIDTWTLLLLDAKGKPLETYFFVPTWRYEDDVVPDRATVPFAFRLPWRNDVKEMDLVAPTLQTEEKRKMAPNPPNLVISAPFQNASVRAHDGKVKIAWQARATSGGSVYYSVFDSTDAGATWNPLVVEVNDVHLELPLAMGKHKVKVIVTDSASSREALVDFTVR